MTSRPRARERERPARSRALGCASETLAVRRYASETLAVRRYASVTLALRPFSAQFARCVQKERRGGQRGGFGAQDATSK
jgi:hypothetical protein